MLPGGFGVHDRLLGLDLELGDALLDGVQPHLAVAVDRLQILRSVSVWSWVRSAELIAE